jgi:hypothetical protein
MQLAYRIITAKIPNNATAAATATHQPTPSKNGFKERDGTNFHI